MKAKWNWMDTLLVLVLAAILALGTWVLLGRGTTDQTDLEQWVDVTVELTDQDEAFAALPQMGDAVVLGEKEKLPATVTKIEVVPAEKQGKDLFQGVYTQQVLPERYHVRVTCSAVGTETDATVSIGSTAMRVGMPMAAKSKNWAGYGFVIGVETRELTSAN